MVLWKEFPCQIIKQSSGPEIAVFTCDAYELNDLSTISRLGEDSEGYQRVLNKRKRNQISEYVNSPSSILPTSIVAAANHDEELVKIEKKDLIEGSENRWYGVIKLRTLKGKKPCLIIDGQHRLKGIISSAKIDFPVSVNLLLNTPTVLQILHFIIINTTATKIQNAMLNELKADIAKLTKKEEDELDSLLQQLGVESITDESFVSLLNDATMIFGNMLDYKTNKIRYISSETIKKSISKSRKDGFLSLIEEDSNKQLLAYNYAWTGVKKAFKKRWDFEIDLAKKAYDTKNKNVKIKDLNLEKKLFHTGSLTVLSEILDTELMARSNRRKWLNDLEKIEVIIYQLLKSVPNSFWEEISVDNTSKGRVSFEKSMDEFL